MGEITYFYKWGIYIGVITHLVNSFTNFLTHPSKHPIFQGAKYVSFMESIAISKKGVWSVQKVKTDSGRLETELTMGNVCSISFRHLFRALQEDLRSFFKTKHGCGGTGSPNDGMSPLLPPPQKKTQKHLQKVLYTSSSKNQSTISLLNFCRCFRLNRATT